MRMYNLTDKSPKELKNLLDTVKAHLDLSVEEKKANLDAIESKLNSFSKVRADVLADIKSGMADIDYLNNT